MEQQSLENQHLIYRWLGRSSNHHPGVRGLHDLRALPVRPALLAMQHAGFVRLTQPLLSGRLKNIKNKNK